MKQHRYSVYFIGATEEVVIAGCPTHAIILACAERIKKGFHLEAFQVHNRDTDEMLGLSTYKALTANYI